MSTYLTCSQILCITDSLRATLELTAFFCSCQPSSGAKMIPNIWIVDTVLLAPPLIRSLHAGASEAAAAFCLNGAVITDEHLMGLKFTQFSVDQRHQC